MIKSLVEWFQYGEAFRGLCFVLCDVAVLGGGLPFVGWCGGLTSAGPQQTHMLRRREGTRAVQTSVPASYYHCYLFFFFFLLRNGFHSFDSILRHEHDTCINTTLCVLVVLLFNLLRIRVLKTLRFA